MEKIFYHYYFMYKKEQKEQKRYIFRQGTAAHCVQYL